MIIAKKSEKTFLIIAIQAVAMISACLETTRAVPFGDGKRYKGFQPARGSQHGRSYSRNDTVH